MVLLTLNYVPGREIDALGMVKGNVVQSKNIGKDLLAGFKNIAGGEIKSYTEMLAEARHIATMRMINEAEAMGCLLYTSTRAVTQFPLLNFIATAAAAMSINFMISPPCTFPATFA